VLFLLLGIWMQELAVIGIRSAAPLGFLCLLSAALALAGYERQLRTRPTATAAAALAALGRAAQARTERRPLVRVVR